jgi:hypothetical protein
MSELVIKDKLPLGITIDGKVYKDFRIRPATLRDSVNAVAALGVEAVGASANTLRYATMAQRVSFEGMPQEQVTLDLLLGLIDRDASALEAASDEVEKKLDALSNS